MLDRLVAALCLMAGLFGTGRRDTPDTQRLTGRLRQEVLRLLRPAEALARRLILLLAREPGLAGQPVPARQTQQPPRRTESPLRVPRSCFSLYEPVAPLTPAQFTLFPARRRPPASFQAPRLLDLSGPYPADSAPPEPDHTPDPLITRIRGLQACLAAPGRYARRLAGAMARRLASSVFRRANPLRPGWPPGARSGHTPADVREMLRLLCLELRARPG